MKNIPTSELLAELQKRGDICIVNYFTLQSIQELCKDHNLKISSNKAKVVLQKIIKNEQFALDYGIETINNAVYSTAYELIKNKTLDI